MRLHAIILLLCYCYMVTAIDVSGVQAYFAMRVDVVVALIYLTTGLLTVAFLLHTCKASKKKSAISNYTKPAGHRKSKRSWQTVQPSDENLPLSPHALAMAASYEFALAVFRAASLKKGNFVISPFCLGIALVLIHDGAKEETQAELTRLLGNSLNPSEVSHIYATLTAALSQKNSDVITSVASRLYLEKELNLQSKFKAHIKKAYSASAINMDFKDGTACANDANAFVKETTRGMIPEVATAHDFAAAAAVLITAVYFNGKWLNTFSKKAAQSKTFHGLVGNRNEQFMCASARFTDYSLSKDLMVVSLDYQDPAYSLLLMMPSNDYAVWKENLSGESLKMVVENLKHGQANLEIPKWKTESSTDGKAIIEKCGVNRIFGESANLSGISTTKFHISSLLHRAVIEVDEKGTKAAGVTEMLIVKGGKSRPRHPVDLKFDRPFVYCLLRDEHIMFIGEPSFSIQSSIFSISIYSIILILVGYGNP